MQGKKLYVGNLNFSVTNDQLQKLFAEHGEVKDAVVIMDKYTDKSKGFGFIEFSSSEDAQNALNALNNREFEGRSLKVNEARPKQDNNRNRDSFGSRY